MTTSSTTRPRTDGGGVVVAGAMLAVVLVVSIAVSVTVGSASLDLSTVVQVVMRRCGIGGADVTLIDDQIVWGLRLPRTVAAAATGAGLGLIGAVLQSLTRNALADPYILGVSSGATVGAVTVIVLGVSVGGLATTAAVSAAAFIGAMGALVLVLVLATGRSGALTPTRTILAGVAVTQMCTAYTSFLVLVKGDSGAARRVLAWTLGSMAGIRWTSAIVLVVATLACLVFVLLQAARLDALAFGESAAKSLGISTTSLRWTLMLVTALLTGVLVSATGAIGFVGLVVPHVVRLFVGPLHRRLLPISALVGGVLLVWADTVARTVLGGQELPIGVVTAAIGAPVFAYLLRREAGSR